MIPPALRKYYGPEWRRYRRAMIARHGNRCTQCGAECPKWLNFAHADHQPQSGAILRLCARCHGRYDAGVSLARRRRTIANRTGQLWLDLAPPATPETPPQLPLVF